MNRAHLEALNAARANREAVALITSLATGESRLVRRGDMAGDPLGPQLAARFSSGRSGREGDDTFVRIHRPPARLMVVGAVHVAQALAPMATAAGFDVTIVDPREAFATADRFSGVRLLAEWPDAENLALDEDTALATLTHDPKIDDPALEAGLASGAFYVGAVGSRKTHGKRVERLTGAGFSAADIARIHAPIGLPIGAAAPAEIAVAILAEVIGALRQASVAAKAPAEAA